MKLVPENSLRDRAVNVCAWMEAQCPRRGALAVEFDVIRADIRRRLRLGPYTSHPECRTDLAINARVVRSLGFVCRYRNRRVSQKKQWLLLMTEANRRVAALAVARLLNPYPQLLHSAEQFLAIECAEG